MQGKTGEEVTPPTLRYARLRYGSGGLEIFSLSTGRFISIFCRDLVQVIDDKILNRDLLLSQF